MKKFTCEKYKYYIGSIFFGILGISNIIGLQQWNKYHGWRDPSQLYGVALVVVAIGIYIFVEKTCKQAETLKCKSCGEVFSEMELKTNKCLKCSGEVMEIKEFYSTSNKNKETNTNPKAD